MSRIYKICLIIALFIASGGVALAGFNYDSANNYFLLDSILNLADGDNNYVLVGNGLIGLPNSLSVSNNLIFLDRGNLKCVGGSSDGSACSENTQCYGGGYCNIVGGELKDNANRGVNKSIFSTPAINLNTTDPTINLAISTIGGSGTLSISGNNINMNQNFMIPNGLGINLEGGTISPRTIYVPKVLANNLESLSTNKTSTPPILIPILIPSATLLQVAPTVASATATEITFDNKPFCEGKKWVITANVSNATVNKASADTGPDITSTKCDNGYYVLHVDATNGIMVCCRYAAAQLNI